MTCFWFHQKSLGSGMGGQSVEDLERVIAAMRRVVERLQGENDQLKKTVGAGGPQYGEVIKENRRLKVSALHERWNNACRAYGNRLRRGNHPMSCLLSREEPVAHSYNPRSDNACKKVLFWRSSDM